MHAKLVWSNNATVFEQELDAALALAESDRITLSDVFFQYSGSGFAALLLTVDKIAAVEPETEVDHAAAS